MKIAFDAKRAFHNATGLGNYSRGLITALMEAHPEAEVRLYTPRQKGRFPEFERLASAKGTICPPRTLPGKVLPWLWRSAWIASDVRKDCADIYHGLSHEIPFGLGRKGIPSVVTVHDLIFLRNPEYHPGINGAIYRAKTAYACRHADRIIAVSGQTKQDIVRFYGVAPGKVSVVYQACDPRFSKPAAEAEKSRVKSALGLPGRFILYVGTVIPRKNLLGLLHAFAALSDKSMALVAVGRGKAYLDECRKFVLENGHSGRVRFIDFVAQEDLPALLSLAECFAYPSFAEGFGIPVLEAASAGVPIVASNQGCIMEAGGPESLYADPSDPEAIQAALESVLSDGQLRVRMRAAGLAHAAKFTRKAWAEGTWEVYREILGR
jgi:glycosyltransferase involved in cell wall biosynthesis